MKSNRAPQSQWARHAAPYNHQSINTARTVLDLIAEGVATWSGGKPAGLAGTKIKGEPLAATVIAERR